MSTPPDNLLPLAEQPRDDRRVSQLLGAVPLVDSVQASSFTIEQPSVGDGTLPASSAARSPARPAARSSRPGGGELADREEGPAVQLELGHRPLSIVRPAIAAPAPVSVWKQEAYVMFDAGVDLRRNALTLPPGSVVREEMLESAEDLLTAARLRGVHAAARSSA